MGDTTFLCQTGSALTSRSLIPCSNYHPTGSGIPPVAVHTPLPGQGTPPFYPPQCWCQGCSNLVANIPTGLEWNIIFSCYDHVSRGIL